MPKNNVKLIHLKNLLEILEKVNNIKHKKNICFLKFDNWNAYPSII